MKYRILAVVLILISVLSINIKAANYEYNITLGEDFTSAQYGDDLTEISQKLNMTADELNAYFSKNGLIYLAVSNDAKNQIRLSAFADNFSSAVSDIAYLDNVALNEFINAISEDDETNCEVIVNNDRKYITVTDTLEDSGGIYTVTQYITICSNKTFYLAGYNEGEGTSDTIKTAFESFYVKTTEPPVKSFTIPTILIIFGIVVFSFVAIFMLIGIIKTLKTSTKEE